MKRFIIAIVFLMGVASNGWAAFYEGSISSGDGLFVPVTDPSSPWIDAVVSWDVYSPTDPGNPNTGFWTYTYTFEDFGTGNQSKTLSHAIIEVSETFACANIYAGTTPGYEGPAQYGPSDPSNPGIPGNIWGIKWGNEVEGNPYSFTIVTDRSPMWGDFYAKGGTYDDGAFQLYAYNTMFGTDAANLYAIGNGNNGGWVLVPDTSSVPIPSAVLLLGAGLMGMAGLRKKLTKS
jgi:hypothetical protein